MGDAHKDDADIRCFGPGCCQWKREGSEFCSDLCQAKRYGYVLAQNEFAERERFIRQNERKAILEELAVWIGVKRPKPD